MPVRDVEAPTLVAGEAVEGDLSPRAQVQRQLVVQDDGAGGGQAPRRILVGGDAAERPAVSRRLLGAPGEGLGVGLGDVGERAPCEEIVLREAHEPLDLTLGEGVAHLAQPGPEANAGHERGVVELPDGVSLHVPAGHDALHVVREDVLGPPITAKAQTMPMKRLSCLALGKSST